jgi:ribonuclease G
MQQDILINWSPQETRVAIIENGAVQELHMERPLERGLVGNVYLGKVSRVLPGMQSAFIDIGLERAAFLHVADVWQRQEGGEAPMFARKDTPPVPIEKQVFEGQTIMVQVIKDPIGTKGARLSTQISIAGRLLVLLPQDDHIGISQKIPQGERDALRARLQGLVGTKETGGGGGFILRTNGEDSSDAELADDIRYLRKTWSRIDSKEQFALLRTFGQEYMPAAVPKLQHYRGERPIFDLFAIDEEIARALGRRVDLKSGGYLIVDQTEALTTIDVNTGGYVGARNFDDTIFKTNLEAAHQIARQLRLRNLGGIIIVDFIDMVRDDHQAEVLSEFKRQLGRDRVKTMAGGFSQLGLVEMTRKRTRESLAHMLCEPCPVCLGKGHVKTVRSVCYEVLREILREARQFNPREFRIVASPKVVEMFLDEESQHLAGLSDFIKKPISLQAETAIAQEQYDIVLL